MKSSNLPQAELRKFKKKVKSGCRTCKIRRVKCDELYPTCQRCSSTGRICDGYGVWGGGSTTRRVQYQRASQASIISYPPPTSVPLLVISTQDAEYFDWFKCRTLPKLQGSFLSEFWNTLLLQSSLSESAVFHAVLSLGSLHKDGHLNSPTDANAESRISVGKYEQVTLHHYVKAIGCLDPHFATKSKASVRVALIVCYTFISVDTLRGHFETARLHLQNGLRLIAEAYVDIADQDNSNPFRDSVDSWIIEAFRRLDLQSQLFNYPFNNSIVISQPPAFAASRTSFVSLKDTWTVLEGAYSGIFQLTRQVQKCSYLNTRVSSSPFNEYQQVLRNDLAQWSLAHEASRDNFGGAGGDEMAKVFTLLSSYATMALIMTETCLHHRNEMVYDTQTPLFLCLANHLSELESLKLSSHERSAMASSIMDLGWIAPLFYLAIKCRIHGIRRQAVKLLESTFHREGIWDSKIAGLVARKVIEIEEGRDHIPIDTGGEILSQFPETVCDLNLLPIVPESQRLCCLEMVLKGGPLETISIFCRRWIDNVEHRVCVAEFNVLSQSWSDVNRQV